MKHSKCCEARVEKTKTDEGYVLICKGCERPVQKKTEGKLQPPKTYNPDEGLPSVINPPQPLCLWCGMLPSRDPYMQGCSDACFRVLYNISPALPREDEVASADTDWQAEKVNPKDWAERARENSKKIAKRPHSVIMPKEFYHAPIVNNTIRTGKL